MAVLSKEEQKETNNRFIMLLEDWKSTNSKKAWDEMFMITYNICLSIGKSKCNGINNPMLEERMMDAAIEGMDIIRRNKPTIKYPIAWNRMHVIKHLYSHKNEDREYSMESRMEELLKDEYTV